MGIVDFLLGRRKREDAAPPMPVTRIEEAVGHKLGPKAALPLFEDHYQHSINIRPVVVGITDIKVADAHAVYELPVATDLAGKPSDPIQYAFERFHADNPKVYSKLVELALSAKANGHERMGIGLLWERLRWYYTVEIRGNDKFKLNNNHRSRYARLIMANEPALEGFFKTRELN